MTYDLTNKLNRLTVTDPQLYCCTPNGAQKAYTTIQAELNESLKVLSTTVFSSLNQAFHYLHQRSAPLGTIDTAHNTKRVEVLKLSDQILAIQNAARRLYPSIPALTDAKEQSGALASIVGFELFTSHLYSESNNLCKLLGNKERNTALELYKATVRECENLTTLSTTEEKISKLKEILTALTSKVTPNAAAMSLMYMTPSFYISAMLYTASRRSCQQRLKKL